MFTSTITDKSFSEGVMQVVVSFSDGTEIITRAFNITSEAELKGQIRRELTRLNELSAFSKTLADGAYDPSDTPQTPPTPAEQEKTTWFRNFNRLEQLTKLNTLGALRPILLTELDELRTTVATDFKKAYIADM